MYDTEFSKKNKDVNKEYIDFVIKQMERLLPNLTDTEMEKDKIQSIIDTTDPKSSIKDLRFLIQKLYPIGA